MLGLPYCLSAQTELTRKKLAKKRKPNKLIFSEMTTDFLSETVSYTTGFRIGIVCNKHRTDRKRVLQDSEGCKDKTGIV